MLDILPQLLVNALITGSIYALASSGLVLTYGLLNILNFAHGHMMMVGAYCFFLLHHQLGAGVALSAAGFVVLVGMFAAICFRGFVLPFIRGSFLLSLVSTLALATVIESLVAIFFGVNVKSISVGWELETFEIYGVYITPIQILIVCSSVVTLSLLAVLVHHTGFGRKMRALSQHPHAAQALGISKTKISYIVFIAGTLLAAFAGVLVGLETNIQPTMGNPYTIKAFAAMVLGGLGNVWGTVIGSYLLGLVENLAVGLDLGTYSIPAGYKDSFAFLIVLLVLLIKPEGMFGSIRRKA